LYVNSLSRTNTRICILAALVSYPTKLAVSSDGFASMAPSLKKIFAYADDPILRARISWKLQDNYLRLIANGVQLI